MSSIPDSDAFNWVIGPATQCVLLVGHATVFPPLLQEAVLTLEQQPVYLKVTREVLKHQQPSALAALDRLLTQAIDSAAMAREHIESDFDSIYKFAVIGLWVPIEVGVEDTCILILSKTAACHRLLDSSFKVRQWAGFLTEDEARIVWRKLESQARTSLSVAEAFSRILGALGVHVTLAPEVIQTLSELNYVRNCVLHRGGVVDDRAQAQAPHLGLAPGMPLKVSSSQYNRYIDAVHKFALSLLNATLYCEHVQFKPSA